MSSGVNRCKPFVRPTEPKDLIELAATMRQEDVEEISHASGALPLEALQDGFAISDCQTVVWGDRVVAVFGCGGVPGRYGYPWMLASDDLVRIRKSFLREAKAYLQLMEDKYTYLTNWAWAKNTVHLEWLKWMGVRFDPPAPIREGGELFIRFHKGNYV